LFGHHLLDLAKGMIELRWKYGRANKGSPELPKRLQYRHWIAYAAANGNAMFPIEPQWSDWKDVPSGSFAALETQRGEIK
jgi:hypothetical protein